MQRSLTRLGASAHHWQPHNDRPRTVLTERWCVMAAYHQQNTRAGAGDGSPGTRLATPSPVESHARLYRGSTRFETDPGWRRYRSIAGDAADLLEFADMWAPYGGAPSDEIFVKFGMTKVRFLKLLTYAVASPECDFQIAQRIRETYL